MNLPFKYSPQPTGYLLNHLFCPAVPLLAPIVPKAMGFLLGKENYSFFRYLLKACFFLPSMCRWFKFFPFKFFQHRIYH